MSCFSARDILVVAGAATGDVGPAAAASRAGATGIVDVSFAPSEDAVRASLDTLARRARTSFGLRIPAHRIAAALDAGTSPCTAIVVPTPGDDLGAAVAALGRRGIRSLVEVVSLEEARLAATLAVDGLVLKGDEAGGRVGQDTSFILLQRVRAATGHLPLWVQGGVGLHSTASCLALGATGIVLAEQVLLARESSLPRDIRSAMARMDGSESVRVAGPGREGFRVLPLKAGAGTLVPLAAAGERLRRQDPTGSADEVRAAWHAETRGLVDWSRPWDGPLPYGQDVAAAGGLADRYVTVGGIVGAFTAAREHIDIAASARPLAEGSALAASHGTRYPILQGPMTRVSDRAAFAAQVAQAGALPFLALALLRRPQVEALLEETARVVADKPWGVGILGFVPDELRQEQLEAVRAQPPSYAIIAGGRPDQALSLESAGIPTYLHVPSPRLLDLFLHEGARRFVFEGRECGGHVGPRSSLLLWDTAVDVLLDRLPSAELPRCHVVLAGGIHDASSAAAAVATTAPLIAAGVKVGVLLGTAYLFTEEAVTSGAIQPGFQRAAVDCARTVLLESGPGHATRAAETPFAAVFEDRRRSLLAAGRPPAEVRDALENLNLGRLRLAAKGLERVPLSTQDSGGLREVDADRQYAEGLYMIGQVATLRNAVVPMAALHAEVTTGASARLVELAAPEPVTAPGDVPVRGDQVAIVGMSCLLPGAPNLATYWRNILGKVDALREVPLERWDVERYYDPDPNRPDKIYSRSGGFLDDILFDPVRWGIPPSALPSIEPLQLLTLHVAAAALDDAGYAKRPFGRDRTAVIIGVGGGIGELGQRYVLRSELARTFADAPPAVLGQLPEWTEDSFPGILLNVAAGRVANRLDLGGVNYTIDAACASSLAAVSVGVQELLGGTSDTVLVGGADTVQSPFAFLCFSKTKALSPGGRCRPFDARADGIAISEGVAMLVLKRLADAERDGDRIYAVLQGVGGSSDGRANGLTAPRPEGQARALDRAYARAGFPPSSVGLIEAHGTGTVVGDRAEATTLHAVFTASGARPRSTALGSVKSMIGHTKCTAGVAGLIKAALALHHGVLPPALGVEEPNPAVSAPDGPFYVNTEARPWVGGVDGAPRRAGVSAFGFGGTNFHAVLEEYADDLLSAGRAPVPVWPAELFTFAARTREDLTGTIGRVRRALEAGGNPPLTEVAAALWEGARGEHPERLAVVAGSHDELIGRLVAAERFLAGEADRLPPGVHRADRPLAAEGGVAFLFPGQGSQATDMLRELSVYLEDVRSAFARADTALQGSWSKPLSAYVFPPPRFSEEEARTCAEELTQTHVAQPALGAAACGLLRLLARLDVRADAVAGHSYGEYVALHAAGVLPEDVLFAVSAARGQAMRAAAIGTDPGTMVAVTADPDHVAARVAGLPGVWIANANSPRQTVLSGRSDAVAAAVEMLGAEGVAATRLAVAAAFHSPMVAAAAERLGRALSALACAAPRVAVYAGSTASTYPADADGIRQVLLEHAVRPVRFRDVVQAMYGDGIRTFVEVGPRCVLSRLVGETLGAQPHLTVPLDGGGMRHLLGALGTLFAHGTGMDLRPLFAGRTSGDRGLKELLDAPAPAVAPTAWLVNGGMARPAGKAAMPQVPVRLTPPSPPVSGDTVSAEPGSNGHTAIPAPGAPIGSDGASTARIPAAAPNAAEAIAGFQQLMRRFLDTQQEVMTAFLGCGTLPAPAPTHVATRPVDVTVASPSTPVTEPPASDGPPVPAVPDASAGLGRESLAELLLQLVSQRTGYPTEMLGLDLDLESELGIDSIKRVEILGALLREVAPERPAGVDIQLGGVRTLHDMLARVESAVGNPPAAPTADGVPVVGQAPRVEPVPVARPAPDDGGSAVPSALPTGANDRWPAPRAVRYDVAAAPAAPAPVRGAPTGAVIVTEDGCGVADRVAAELESRGVPVVRVGPLTGAGESGQRVDLAAAAAAVLDETRRRNGGVAGLVHLLPLHPGADIDDLDSAAWEARVRDDVGTLFALARAAGPDLRRAAATGRAVVVAATALGGRFGLGAVPTPLQPTGGGVAGLVKAIAAEWPQVHARVVDLAPSAPADDAAAWVLDEILAGDTGTEIGYSDGQRLLVEVVPGDLDDDGEPVLAPDSVLLVLGGARGITARTFLSLAERYRPTLVIAGRSPEPSATDLAGFDVDDERSLKAALIAERRDAGAPLDPADIEREFQRLRRAREIATGLAAIRATGASVRYVSMDARDEGAMESLVAEIYRCHGKLDGVVHAAGVLSDRLIEDTPYASFAEVFETKVLPARALLGALPSDYHGFVLFFSSVAGRFGNRGQVAYAAGNEAMAKIALAFRRRGARALVVHWGPWRGSGMVTPEVARQFEHRGVALLEPETAIAALDRELRSGPAAGGEVVLAADAGCPIPMLAAHGSDGEQPAGPYRPQAAAAAVGGNLVVELDPARQCYLHDHRLDGHPVLPAAMALEIMAEAASAARPSLQVVEVRSAQVLHGVVLDGRPARVRVAWEAPVELPSGGAEIDLTLASADTGRVHYRARVVLADTLPPAPRTRPGTWSPPGTANGAPGGLVGDGRKVTGSQAYREWLFHGPSLRCIRSIDLLDGCRLVATVEPSTPERLLHPGATGSWVIDPAVVDGVAQLVIVWSRRTYGTTALPVAFAAVRRHRCLSGSIRCVLDVRADGDPASLLVDATLLDEQGSPAMVIEGMSCVAAASLNRLADSVDATAGRPR